MTVPHMPEIKERYDFANGWSIVVHTVKASQVYFQRWPPGVNRQSFIANCARMPIPAFVSAINQQIVLESAHA